MRHQKDNSMNKYSPKNLDKNLVQSLYDSGLSLRQLAKELKVAVRTIQKLSLRTRTLKESQKFITRNLSLEGRKSLSESAKKRKLGGYRPHPNKGVKYKNIWFDSKWELTVAQSLDDNNIKWERPKFGFTWTECGKKYYPDFYLPDYRVYLDPKNEFLRKRDRVKIHEAQKRNNIRVLILSEQNLNWDSIKDLI